MKSFKVKLSLIIALAFVFMATLGAFLGIRIADAERLVTISGSTVFYTSGSSEVWAHREEREPLEDDKDDDHADYYTLFTFLNDTDSVSYRRNLAYEWYYDATDEDDYLNEDEDSDEEKEVVAEPKKETGHLYLEIGFEAVNFKKFTVTFETQQYNQTKDDKTTNYVIFVPDGEDKVFVVVTDDKEVAEGDVDTEDAVSMNPDHIAIALSDGANGDYGVEIYNKGADGAKDNLYTDTFKNVGKTYARYVSSSSNPVVPLSFQAEFAETEEDEGERARMALYELNGQSFKLYDEDRPINTINGEDGNPDHYTGGQVNDTTPPVLCLTNGLTYIEKGTEITFSTTVIDVLTTPQNPETGYFMLTNEQAEKEDFNANNYNAKNLYQIVKDSDDQYMIPHAEHYLPEATGVFGDDFKPVAAVKVYLKLTDTESDGGQTTYVMLDWYVDDDYLIHDKSGNSYIAVASDEKGAAYSYEDGDKDWKAIVDAYQAEVTKAAEDLEAGSQNYFYLPDASSLFYDNATAYVDMTYSIYFDNGSQQSDTNNASDNLSINLTRAETYVFTIYAHDGKNNDMWYTDKEGKEQTFAVGDIWTMYEDEDEEGLRDYLPWFTFEVGSSEISVEDPDDQDTAYVGSEYTAGSFEINGVAYEATYSLYLFDIDGYFEDNGELLTYDDFMSRKRELFEEHREYFTLIRDADELDETDDDYETQNAYGWSSNSRTFTPQDSNAFYLIKCEVKSTEDYRPAEKAYMGIAASVRPRAIHGEDTWVQDNMVSIILLSIAGASLIGIVLLLVIKPRNKGDIDEQFEVERTRKAVKNKD